MHVVIIVLTVIVAVLLIGIVLIQKSKGGGLSSQFGGAGSVMGVRQTNSFLEKATWTLVSCLAILSIIAAFTMPRNAGEAEIRTQPAAAPTAVDVPAGQFDTPVALPEPTEAAEAPATEE
ncbi:MAG: preprotein translocase subunit SecG [Muribaculaceae bacterium]|nr:preprotein translocase subunit SecG [Muribaculaceae bacterium]